MCVKVEVSEAAARDCVEKFSWKYPLLIEQKHHMRFSRTPHCQLHRRNQPSYCTLKLNTKYVLYTKTKAGTRYEP